jgi:hypothetical protein
MHCNISIWGDDVALVNPEGTVGEPQSSDVFRTGALVATGLRLAMALPNGLAFARGITCRACQSWSRPAEYDVYAFWPGIRGCLHNAENAVCPLIGGNGGTPVGGEP